MPRPYTEEDQYLNFLAKRERNQKEYKGTLVVDPIYNGQEGGKRRSNSGTRRRRMKRKGTRRA